MNNTSMNQMRHKEINVNKVLYKTLTTTNFNFESMTLLFKSAKIKKDMASELTRWMS